MTDASGDSLISELQQHLARGQKWVRESPPKHGQLRMWLGVARNMSKKLFDANSSFVLSWPLPSDISNDRLVFEVERGIHRLTELLDRVSTVGKRRAESVVFIGHGRSDDWRRLKDFLVDRLDLKWQEFNRDPVAGLTTWERLEQMLSESSFAFLVMTAEDEHADGRAHARENVVHEVGLFQGRLGARRAIVLLEDGCVEFSNILGLSQLRFPKGHISAIFEEVRRVLEREEIIRMF